MDVDGEDPVVDGLYVAYVDPDLDIPYAQKIFLMWMNNRWGYPGSDQKYRGNVYGWLGPIPAMKLT